jgi:hypothetical protein
LRRITVTRRQRRDQPKSTDSQTLRYADQEKSIVSPFPTTTEPTLEPKQDSQPEAKTPSRTSDNDGTKPDSKAQAKEDLKPDAKPKSGDDLKSIPMADLQKKLGSSPDGLSQGEAQKRLTQ